MIKINDGVIDIKEERRSSLGVVSLPRPRLEGALILVIEAYEEYEFAVEKGLIWCHEEETWAERIPGSCGWTSCSACKQGSDYYIHDDEREEHFFAKVKEILDPFRKARK